MQDVNERPVEWWMARLARCLALGAAGVLVRGAGADVVVTPRDIAGSNDTACVAAAGLAGWYATGDTFQDRIEVLDQWGNVRRAITRGQLQAMAPWMSLDGGPDGPSGLGFSASGRSLYILLHDDTLAPDGQGSDAVLWLDISTGALTRIARLDLFDRGDVWPHLAVAHHGFYVYVGTVSGQIVPYFAYSSGSSTIPQGLWTLPGGAASGPVHGLTIDRENGTLYAANDAGVYRATLPGSPSSAPTFTLLASGLDIRALAWADHYGGAGQRGLYILSGGGAGAGSKVEFIGAATAASGVGVTPTLYATSTATWHDLASTADGRMIVGADEDAVMLSDTADARLGFEAWMRDELAQATRFGRGLISPDGEPNGWVIDGDVIPAWSRFHPATPDGAAWTVLMLMLNERVNGDAQARQDVSRVLTRYAGLAPDGIKPVRNVDGIFKHWLDPQTGNTKFNWADEYATLSTMKIVAAAARAMDRYPDDPAIVRAASRIIFLTKNWDGYVQAGSSAIAFKGLAGGGADAGSFAAPYHEGIIFAEQAGVYGGSIAQGVSVNWFNRGMWPTASYLPGKAITVAVGGQFQPAFLSLYPALLSAPFRADAGVGGWRTQVDNVRWNSAAWTDDNGARYFTVFSAGTSPAGYNADTISNHPGNLTTFTSLLALAALGDPAEAVAGYAAYRKGARQTFKTGASILYRRPYDGTNFVPNSAGLPDVALGALGLCELMQPGSIDALLARPYPTAEMCPQDLSGDGRVTIDDLYAGTLSPADFGGDGVVNGGDLACLENWLRRTELQRMSARH